MSVHISSVKQMIEKYSSMERKEYNKYSYDTKSPKCSFESIKARVVVGTNRIWIHSEDPEKLSKIYASFVSDKDTCFADFTYSMCWWPQLEYSIEDENLGEKFIVFCETAPNSEKLAKKYGIFVCQV